ncbi:NmrA/HSCARG family protein [Buttiauxella sp. 3AFRM03]|uniref:NmrA/HSCARG family protein n=1 Tax=Buttiauxella sp. 3AFRM03 TaxID=2479367 RepID=UPI000EF82B43|nr:NmrA/HSCARG family protein [Buttiauxella sp. 3AFRM03]AYN25961.1 NmrA/HSCARG family protein [Buttiauxella sp. 3AFRM03]
MSSNQKPVITVVGALSKQGRSVVRTLLESQRYQVRALTRRMDSPQAQELAKLGVEFINVPLEPGHKQDFIQAFKGAHGVFMMTPGITPEAVNASTHETELGKEIADAAVEAGVQHLVFTSLENVDRITDGAKWVPHFTDKGRIEDYIRTLPISSSFIMMAFFYTNLLEYYQPRFEGDTLVFPIYLPEDFHAPFVDPLTATGPAVLEIFDNQNKYTGCALPVVGEFLSPKQIVETFSRVTGIKAAYRPAMTRDEMLQYFPSFADMGGLVDELVGMSDYAVEYGYYSKERDVQWSRQVNPNALTWEQFLQTTGWQGQGHSFGL